MAAPVVSMVLNQLGTFFREEIEKEVRMVVGAEKEIQKLVLGAKEEIEKLEVTLTAIQAVLYDADKKQVQDQRVKLWLERLTEVVYEIEDILDKWNTKIIQSKIKTQSKDKKVCSHLFYPCFCFKNRVVLRHNFGREIKKLREKLDSIDRDKNNYGLASGMPTKVAQAPPRQTTSSLVNVSEIIGRDVERDIIVSKLLSESSHNDQIGVPIISIVGMGGLGKTTLAQLVSSDENVVKHFEKILWVCVSEPFDRIRLAKAIIEAIEGKVPTDHEWDVLHRHLSEAIKNKLFMLVLDDVWTRNHNNWSSFKLSLDGGAPGSRILVTTRKEGVAAMMKSTFIHLLVGLSEKNSWSLFSFAASIKKEDKDYEMFEEIGKAITKKCNGVPLSLKTAGNLMGSKKKIQDWQQVLESKIWNLPETVKDVLPALLLSYHDLPSSWKPCFTYCATFPKDYILEKDELIKLWMAHGFLHSTQNKEMEKVGEEYFDGIVSRSLFQDVKTDEGGNIRSCTMHDLVHDLVQFLTKNETLIVERNDITVNSIKLRHLNARNLDDTRATLSSIHNTSLRSLNLKFYGRDGKIRPLWTCLRSLDLSDSIISTLPDEIGELIHLRYLDLSRTRLSKLPNSLSYLCNLQTLKLNGCQFLCELPASMGNMISLRHLEIYDTKSLISLPKGIERLTSLRSLSKFIVSEGRKLGDLKGLNLIQGSIEISGLWGVKSANEAKEVHLANKRGIHALTLDFATTHSWVSREFINLSEGVLEGLQPHPNLEELKINQYPGSKLPSWMMSDLAPMYSKLRTLELMNLTQCTSTTLPSLGRLPMLEVLKIEGMKSVRRLGLDFLGISDIEEEEDNNATSSINSGQLIAFPSLIQLELSSMGELEEWVLPFERSDTLQIMPRLRILTIYYAPKLKMLPALGRLESLEALSIGGLHLVKRIGPEFFGISEDDDVRMKSVRRLGLDFLGILDIEEENDDATSSINREKLVVLPNLIELVLEKIWELEEWVLPFERSDTLQIMPCLRILTIYYAPKLKVPALGRLESRPNRLTDFILTSSSWKTIDGLHSLKRIGPEFFGISEDDVTKGTGGSSRGGESLPIIVFPKLKKLRFRFTHDWEEWEMMMPSWRQDASFIMPRLECLELWFCQKLKVVPHNIFSYQRVKERIEGCLELNQRSGMNQIIKRREVGESTGKMALFRRLFNRKLPNQLLEISERVYGA